jgi:hypothetical protein
MTTASTAANATPRGTVDFATELWDEPAVVLKRVEQSATLAATLSRYFRKRAEVEQKYGKELSSLHASVGPSSDTLITFLGGKVF